MDRAVSQIITDGDGGRAEISATTTRRAQPVRLVFLVRGLSIGGAERQLVTLAKALDRKLFDVTVLCLYGGGAFERELTTHGVRVISLEKKARWEVVGFLWRLARQLRTLEPEILHSYFTAENLMAMLMKPALPSSRIVWGLRASKLSAGTQSRLDRWLVRLGAALSSFADLVIFNSYAGQVHAQSMGYRCKSELVIPNGIDREHFSPNEYTRDATRRRWGITKGSLLIGIVGRLDPMKDHPTFLKASAIFAKSHPEAMFAFVGDGPEQYARELEVLAADLGLSDRLIRTGILADMPAAYNALDICCSSSVSEGTPNCVAEAMACGIPCVVTDVGDSRLVVGATGIVVPAKNPEALAAGWEVMADRLRKSLNPGRLARKRVEEQFGVDALVRRTSEALLNIL